MWPNNEFGISGGSGAFDGRHNQNIQYRKPLPSFQQTEDTNDEKMESNSRQPESFNNSTTIAQNRYPSAAQQSLPAPINPQTAGAATATLMKINPRAAELKAKLMKSKRSTTPIIKQSSPPAVIGGNDVDDLIKEYKPAELDNTRPLSQAMPLTSARTQETNNQDSPLKHSLPASSDTTANIQLDKMANHGSPSEFSEGEIAEDGSTPSMQPKKTTLELKQPSQQIPKPTSNGQGTRRASRNEDLVGLPLRQSPSHLEPVKRSSSGMIHSHPDRENHRDYDNTHERRTNSLEYNGRSSGILEARIGSRQGRGDTHNYNNTRRGSREHIEESRKPEPKKFQKRDDYVAPSLQARQEPPQKAFRELRPPTPTLSMLLPLDADLKEWLEITGYHNEDYRSKILTRRRKLAELEAQKAQLLAEMEVEERGGVPAPGGPISTPAPPPPPPAKPAISKTNGTKPDNADIVHSTSSKRGFSQMEAERGEASYPKKSLRTDEHRFDNRRAEDIVRAQHIKEEDADKSVRGARSFTAFDSYRGDRRDERDFEGRGQGRGRGRGYRDSRERSFSPRFHLQERTYSRRDEYDSDNFDPEFSRNDPRPFLHVGAYRGRAFDPNYRGRGGRGRGDIGRGEGRGDFVSGRGFDRGIDFQNEGFGSVIANRKPYTDRNGYSRGERGDTRYFIIKSFNEENVLRCIDDNIWTTQVQNGEVFKEAFRTCKNVILVFSINKSRAFQGYARMESLPGSVTPPSWQKAINWESTGAFRVRWLTVCSTRFPRIAHLKNALNDGMAVLIGKDGQEIEEGCGEELVRLIDEEADLATSQWRDGDDGEEPRWWDD